MTGAIDIVLLCEDSQHESFVHRFLRHAGFKARDIRTEKGKRGQGSGAQHVISMYPSELEAQRKYATKALIVMIDDDTFGYDTRMQQLNKKCTESDVNLRSETDCVAIIVPAREIETWIHYLQGDDELIDERRQYSKLSKAGDCAPQAKN